MNKQEITEIIANLESTKERNLVVIDFGNLVRWQDSLGWKIGIKELKDLIKHLTYGKKFLRRFYYGSDYGQKESCDFLTPWSEMILMKATMNDFQIITKRVKYIHDNNYKTGYVKKCDFDVEMTVDMIRERDDFDNIILFSGDGDLAYALKYLSFEFKKNVYVFVARNHLGRELLDCRDLGIVQKILFVEDFEYRLNRDRFRV